ncbi:MAG: hypothetical protein ACD_49C00061G0002 [uncultured bacterium (gcode 4)]|uniref:Uncharacterized protein n=1 Tax=uncultured bacterium (gcode 4) TaxID=1234023 RepID=K2ADR4_9BACT|nr:MAG: hypothetical protein ACD_49C00061G0002 [uncultured bacterium (gcode 4)]
MIKNNKWNTLIYAIILVNIAIVIMYIVLNKSNYFSNSLSMQNYNIKLNENLRNKATNSLKYETYLNTNWSGFVDTITCPSDITLSGTTLTWTISQTIPYFDTNSKILTCSWSNASWSLILTYNASFSWFTEASYNNFTGSLYESWLYYTWILNDPDLSQVSFTGSDIYSGIDSNFNSDNYKINSTGWVNYPDNYTDDDTLARKTIYWYINSDKTFSNIFWNNYKTNEYIRNNPNNYDTKNVVIWNTSSGILFLDVNFPYSLKIIEFNKDNFIQKNELVKLRQWTWNWASWSWYLALDWNDLLTLKTLSSSGMIFDFKNKNYAIFLAYNSSNIPTTLLKFRLTAENENWLGVYINPINDSNSENIRYLWSDIIIDNGKYISKITEY